MIKSHNKLVFNKTAVVISSQVAKIIMNSYLAVQNLKMALKMALKMKSVCFFQSHFKDNYLIKRRRNKGHLKYHLFFLSINKNTVKIKRAIYLLKGSLPLFCREIHAPLTFIDN